MKRRTSTFRVTPAENRRPMCAVRWFSPLQSAKQWAPNANSKNEDGTPLQNPTPRGKPTGVAWQVPPLPPFKRRAAPWFPLAGPHRVPPLRLCQGKDAATVGGVWPFGTPSPNPGGFWKTNAHTSGFPKNRPRFGPRTTPRSFLWPPNRLK